MLLSMTGQGSAHLQQNGISVAVELRTVNNRYYKLAYRATDGYASLEPLADELVRQAIRRGTVQMDLRIEREASPESFRINEVALQSYVDQLQRLRLNLKRDRELRVESLLALPGVVDEQRLIRVDAEVVWPVVSGALQQALASLTRMREEEGRAMAEDLAENCRLVASELAAIERLAPRVVEGYRQRLTDRLTKLLEERGLAAEPGDLVREVGLFAERTDISEEVVRLRSHLEQFLAVMQSADSSGRKLDFLTQEMFRETNTIGSKANDAQIALHVVEIKTAIERVREMVQNVE